MRAEFKVMFSPDEVCVILHVQQHCLASTGILLEIEGLPAFKVFPGMCFTLDHQHCHSFPALKTDRTSHVDRRNLQVRAPFKPSPSQHLPNSILFCSGSLRMASRDSAWVLDCLTRQSDSGGRKVRPYRKTKEFRTKDHWGFTQPPRKEAS